MYIYIYIYIYIYTVMYEVIQVFFNKHIKYFNTPHKLTRGI